MLYFGQIHELRYSVALAEAAQAFPPDWTLVMHGWGPSETFDRIRAIDRAGRVRISRDLVSPERVLDVVGSATAGFALYAPTPWNDQLTACASEKMAFYPQCGVPFVAFDYPNYRRVLSGGRWGVLVESVREIPAAHSRIVEERQAMRVAAFRAFALHYDFRRRFSPVVAKLRELPTVGASSSWPAPPVGSNLVLRPPPESWNAPAWIREICGKSKTCNGGRGKIMVEIWPGYGLSNTAAARGGAVGPSRSCGQYRLRTPLAGTEAQHTRQPGVQRK